MTKHSQIFQEGFLERQISGSLRNTVQAHGPITLDFLGSASKRIASAIRGVIFTELELLHNSDSTQPLISRYKREIETQRRQLITYKRTSHFWRLQALQASRILEAQQHAATNATEIKASVMCGCFFCRTSFPSAQIEKFEAFEGDEDATAFCPECHMDSVIGDASGFQLNPQFLALMHDFWFTALDEYPTRMAKDKS